MPSVHDGRRRGRMVQMLTKKQGMVRLLKVALKKKVWTRKELARLTPRRTTARTAIGPDSDDRAVGRVTYTLKALLRLGLMERVETRVRTGKAGQPPFGYRVTADGRAWVKQEQNQ